MLRPRQAFAPTQKFQLSREEERERERIQRSPPSSQTSSSNTEASSTSASPFSDPPRSFCCQRWRRWWCCALSRSSRHLRHSCRSELPPPTPYPKLLSIPTTHCRVGRQAAGEANLSVGMDAALRFYVGRTLRIRGWVGKALFHLLSSIQDDLTTESKKRDPRPLYRARTHAHTRAHAQLRDASLRL